MQSKEWEIKFPQLPYYFTIIARYDDKEDTVKVVIHSKIHVNKAVTMPNSWSKGYVSSYPNRFQGDILSYVIKSYGLKLEPVKYS